MRRKMDFYDECLVENPFFRIIQENHGDLIQKATEEAWIVCIPRVGTIEPNSITEEDILENVLVPNPELPVTHFYTLCKRQVCVRDGLIIVDDHPVRVLFDETFYINQHRKYKVLCIERPLHKKHMLQDIDFNMRNVHDCIKLLWTKDNTILNNINGFIENYLEDLYEFEDLSVLKVKSGELYERSVNETNRESYMHLVVETYIQYCVHLKLFRAICNFTAQSDATLNKTLRNLSDIQLKDLEINVAFSECISSIKRQFSNFNKAVTVFGKIECLRRIIDTISIQKNVCVTTDDLLKIFVFLLIKSNLTNWIANLAYITHFRFALINLNDKHSFLITTLEAAIEYTRKGDISVKFRFDNDYLSSFFARAQSGDLEAVQKMYENDVNRMFTLCHPLCTCEKCTFESINVNSCNDKGWSVLHVACVCGHPHLVEYFLNKKVNVNMVDDLGMTPLHYASSKGHQNALLLLLHADADTEVKDSNGNTPLHLAANNGHDSCVKAILYYKEQKGEHFSTNVKNNVGDTPLHLSAKWGYAGITTILIQYGADPKVPNKWNRTAFDISSNDYIKKLLSVEAPEVNSIKVPLRKRSRISPNVCANLEYFKKIDLLLKTIKNDDLPLMCYYLGIPVLQNSTVLVGKSICHPLCTCDSCVQQFENVSLKPSSSETLNVNVHNAEGYTPLHVAAKYGRLTILRLLLDEGAVVNVKTSKEQHTPLHLACQHQQIQVVRELLKCGGCTVDVQDVRAELLLIHGCNVRIKNANGNTALQEAHTKMFPNVIRLFKIEHNNNIENLDSLHFTL
ncbi:hypothetical protein FQA39_LY18441 [Lamprigera yunnana]|nr:hypothetical protein FQA39_LY18441 [Lamprigera yunnana]